MLQKLRDRIGVYFKGIMIPRETVDKAIELMEHPHQDIASILNQVYEMTETGKEVKTQPRIESVKDHIKKAYKDILFHEELCMTLDGQSYVSGNNYRVWDKPEGLKITMKFF